MAQRIIAILNHKGGVGKTTTCFNLACAFADQEFRVLAVDLDPQAHLGVSLGKTETGYPGVDDIFLEQGMAADYIETVRENLDLLPAGYRLAEIERLAARGRSQAIRLRDALQPCLPRYDMVLIDCPPTSGLLNFNALYAANEVIIPVSGDYLALHGLSQLMRTLRSAERFMEKKLQLWIVLTRYATRRRLAAQVKEKLEKYFPSQVLATVIRENAPLAECPSFAKSIFDYSRRSNGAQDYAALADDVLYRRVVPSS